MEIQESSRPDAPEPPIVVRSAATGDTLLASFDYSFTSEGGLLVTGEMKGRLNRRDKVIAWLGDQKHKLRFDSAAAADGTGSVVTVDRHFIGTVHCRRARFVHRESPGRDSRPSCLSVIGDFLVPW